MVGPAAEAGLPAPLRSTTTGTADHSHSGRSVAPSPTDTVAAGSMPRDSTSSRFLVPEGTSRRNPETSPSRKTKRLASTASKQDSTPQAARIRSLRSAVPQLATSRR